MKKYSHCKHGKEESMLIMSDWTIERNIKRKPNDKIIDYEGIWDKPTVICERNVKADDQLSTMGFMIICDFKNEKKCAYFELKK